MRLFNKLFGKTNPTQRTPNSATNVVYQGEWETPQQFQRIQNRRVIDHLEKHGDKLTKAREVDHWIYFKTETDRETFLQKIANDKFSIVDKGYDKELGELPFRLHLKRVDKVDHHSVDEYSNYLWQIANVTNGDYDGWGTSVEKD